MIDKETLLRISKLTGLKPFQQEKNYLQTMLLRSLYSNISRELVFKGGTALAFFYGLNRFSEDLDFTLEGSLELENLLEEVKKDFEVLGIKANFKILDNDQRSFSFRIGAEGPFFTKEIERCYVRVEISKREKVLRKVDAKELRPIYSDILPFFVILMDLEEILAEKVRAIIWRGKARDLYDLWFLIKMNVKIDIPLIDKKLIYYRKRFDIEKFVEKVKSLNTVWEQELRPVVVGNLPNFEVVERDVAHKFYSQTTNMQNR
ncbi:MAG: nucleotidyl transferase AbiEii/AbiGii toxin family protein [Nitrososphaeria archaeon]